MQSTVIGAACSLASSIAPLTAPLPLCRAGWRPCERIVQHARLRQHAASARRAAVLQRRRVAQQFTNGVVRRPVQRRLAILFGAAAEGISAAEAMQGTRPRPPPFRPRIGGSGQALDCATRCRRAPMQSPRPWRVARTISLASLLAPRSSSSRTTSRWLYLAATCNGVLSSCARPRKRSATPQCSIKQTTTERRRRRGTQARLHPNQLSA